MKFSSVWSATATCKEVGARTEHGDEELGLDHASCLRVLVVRLVSREVDKQLLSRLVGKAHHRIGLFEPVVVEGEEAAALIAVGMLPLVLLVQELEGHPFFCQLFREVDKIRQGLCRNSLLLGEEKLFQCIVAQDAQFLVGNLELLEPVNIGMRGGRGDVARPRDGTDPELQIQKQPGHFLQFFH